MDPLTAGAGPDPSTTRRPESDSGARRPMREDDLLDLVWIADPQISPDGSRIAFVHVSVDRDEDRYRTALWIADTAGGLRRALTAGPFDSQPRWSPDGASLAFLRKTDPEKEPQVFVLPMGGGEAVAVTALAKGASSPAWSPDGKRIAFLSATNPDLDRADEKKPKHEPARIVTRPVYRENNGDYFDDRHRDHVWVVDVAGGAPRPLTRGTFAESEPRWSRDGRRVLFLSDRRAEPWFGDEHGGIYAVPADLETATDGAAVETVLEHDGGIAAFAEAPDGRLAVIASTVAKSPRSYNQPDLLIVERAGDGPKTRRINPRERLAVGETVNSDQHPPRGGGATPLAWNQDGRAVFARVCREGQSFLARFDLDGDAVTELTPANADLVAGTASACGRRWALTLGGHATPGDLCFFDAEAGALKRLWAPNEEKLRGLALGEVEEFWFDSFDGTKIQCWLMKPPGFDPARRYPLVLEIHGGPHTAYGAGFFHEFHMLAGAGYLVLFPNPRGSTSYGSDFANVIQYRFPGDDARDLLAAVDHVAKRGYVDEKRLGVTGGSGGGLLTNWLIAWDSRFAAAVTQRCVSDWRGMYDCCDFTMYVPFWFRKSPLEDPAEWAERSPITYVGTMTTPLMIIHSENDWRTPIDQGEALFRALKELRRTVVMIRFPGENHELSRSGMPSRRVENQRHIRGWFDRWLLGTPKPEYGV